VLCFTGKEIYSVDVKRRVNIPASAIHELSILHKANDNSKDFHITEVIFHLTRGQNDCLFVYPRQIFMQMASRLNSHFGSRGTDNEDERRYFLETMSDAHPVRCDQQGRITVPQEHLDYARIKGKVIVIGAVDHLEFWDPDEYHTFINKSTTTPKDRVKRYGWVEKETHETPAHGSLPRPDSSP
jgi:MraZ protein